MLLFVGSIFVQVIAVLIVLYHIVPLSWIAGFLRLIQNSLPYFLGASALSVNIRGIDISYLIRNPRASSVPSSRTTAVFIHGATSYKYTFYPVFKCLPKSWTLVALDLPGHGDSTFREDSSYTHVEMEGFLHEFFQKLGLTNFHLIGQSMGSVYCSRYAAQHPDVVQSLTVICPPGLHRIGSQCTECMAIIDDRERLQDTSTPHPFFPMSGREAREVMKLCFIQPARFPLRVLDAVIKMKKEHYPHYRKVMLDLHSLASDKSVQEMVNDVHVPLQVIWGREDQVCHVSGTDIIKEMKKDARIGIIDNCGHVVSEDRPAVCSKLIAEFVQFVTSGKSTN